MHGFIGLYDMQVKPTVRNGDTCTTAAQLKKAGNVTCQPECTAPGLASPLQWRTCALTLEGCLVPSTNNGPWPLRTQESHPQVCTQQRCTQTQQRSVEEAKWINQVETLTIWARDTAATHTA